MLTTHQLLVGVANWLSDQLSCYHSVCVQAVLILLKYGPKAIPVTFILSLFYIVNSSLLILGGIPGTMFLFLYQRPIMTNRGEGHERLAGHRRLAVVRARHSNQLTVQLTSPKVVDQVFIYIDNSMRIILPFLASVSLTLSLFQQNSIQISFQALIFIDCVHSLFVTDLQCRLTASAVIPEGPNPQSPMSKPPVQNGISPGKGFHALLFLHRFFLDLGTWPLGLLHLLSSFKCTSVSFRLY